MRGLKATRDPGLFKYKGIYCGWIKVGKRDKFKSFRTQSESAALASLGTWRKELELEQSQAAAGEGVTKHQNTVGWASWKLKAKKRNSADLSPDTADLGLGSPRVRAEVAPCPLVMCVATTAFVHPGRSALSSPPVPWVDAQCFVSLPACAGFGSSVGRIARRMPGC
jgi:hypothetical protein